MSLRVRELTPRGMGAVSVLRVSGNGAAAALRSIGGGAQIRTGEPRLLKLRIQGEELEESLGLALSAEEVELHVHGSPPLVRRLIEHLGGIPPIEAGPRSLESMAAERLAHASCESGARILLDQSQGALSRALRSLVAMGEARRDRAIAEMLERWQIARWALEPAVVVLAGPANAGKSTLFNALVGESRAIVDAEPGTTRDPVRERADLGVWPVWLVDTAGERQSSAAGEDARLEDPQASVGAQSRDRARRARGDADLVLWLEPLGRPRAARVPEPDDRGGKATRRLALVHSFADLVPPETWPATAISARDDPKGARARIAQIFRRALDLPLEPWEASVPVPFSVELALSIERLRDVSTADLARSIDSLVRPE